MRVGITKIILPQFHVMMGMKVYRIITCYICMMFRHLRTKACYGREYNGNLILIGIYDEKKEVSFRDNLHCNYNHICLFADRHTFIYYEANNVCFVGINITHRVV